VLQTRTSCRAVVRQVQAYGETEHRHFDENTSAYCQARGRLSLTCLERALADSAEAADRLSFQGVPDWNRPIKVVDGTGIRLPDTDANRKRYPYPTGQRHRICVHDHLAPFSPDPNPFPGQTGLDPLMLTFKILLKGQTATLSTQKDCRRNRK